jgi:hypothetical protein
MLLKRFMTRPYYLDAPDSLAHRKATAFPMEIKRLTIYFTCHGIAGNGSSCSYSYCIGRTGNCSKSRP